MPPAVDERSLDIRHCGQELGSLLAGWLAFRTERERGREREREKERERERERERAEGRRLYFLAGVWVVSGHRSGMNGAATELAITLMPLCVFTRRAFVAAKLVRVSRCACRSSFARSMVLAIEDFQNDILLDSFT